MYTADLAPCLYTPEGSRVEWLDTPDGEWLEQTFSLDKIKRYFRTRSHAGMADPDGCRARDMVALLLDGDDDETHSLLRESPHSALPHR